jgi:hypothetical protein
MRKAAQWFSLRRTFGYAAGGNPRRTHIIGKRAIYELEIFWSLIVIPMALS